MMAMASDAALYSMSKADEDALVARARAGDRAAMGVLYRKNRRIVMSITRAIAPKGADEATIEDLAQEGAIGLMRALDKYDATRGFRFSTYAGWWVRSAVTVAVYRERGRGIRVLTTKHARKVFHRAGAIESKSLAATGSALPPEELAQILGITVSELFAARTAARLGYSDAYAAVDELLSQVPDDSSPTEDDILDGIDAADVLEDLQSCVAVLKPRDQEIVRRRFMNGHQESLRSIADSFGLSRERARQLEEIALHTLRVEIGRRRRRRQRSTT